MSGASYLLPFMGAIVVVAIATSYREQRELAPPPRLMAHDVEQLQSELTRRWGSARAQFELSLPAPRLVLVDTPYIEDALGVAFCDQRKIELTRGPAALSMLDAVDTLSHEIAHLVVCEVSPADYLSHDDLFWSIYEIVQTY